MHACLGALSLQWYVTPCTVAHQALLFMRFSSQEYWSGLPCSPPGDLPDPGMEPVSLTLPALASRFFTTSTTWEAIIWGDRWQMPLLWLFSLDRGFTCLVAGGFLLLFLTPNILSPLLISTADHSLSHCIWEMEIPVSETKFRTSTPFQYRLTVRAWPNLGLAGSFLGIFDSWVSDGGNKDWSHLCSGVPGRVCVLSRAWLFAIP